MARVMLVAIQKTYESQRRRRRDLTPRSSRARWTTCGGTRGSRRPRPPAGSRGSSRRTARGTYKATTATARRSRAPKLVGLLWGSLVQAKGCREAPGVAISGAQRLPRTQLVRGDALARTTAARVRDARTSSRFSERYRPRGENPRPRARDGWNADRHFLASDAFWCPRRPSTTPERE